MSRFYVDDGIGTLELQTSNQVPDGLLNAVPGPPFGTPIDDLPWWPYGDGIAPNDATPGSLFFPFSTIIPGPDDPLPTTDSGNARIDLPVKDENGRVQIRFRCTPALPSGTWDAWYRDGGTVVFLGESYWRSLQPVTYAEYRVVELLAINTLVFEALGARVTFDMIAGTIGVEAYNGGETLTGSLSMPDYSGWCVLCIDRIEKAIEVAIWEGDLEDAHAPDLTFDIPDEDFDLDPGDQELLITAEATGVDENWKLLLDIIVLNTPDTSDLPIGDQEC